MQAIKVGLLGFGVVGSATFSVLARNQEEIRRRAGRGIEIVMIANRNTARARERVSAIQNHWHCQVVNDANQVIAHPEIEIVIEAIGGTTLAREFVLAAIAQNKHVVTANKALIALHGNEIFSAAQARGVVVAFEAAVAGGIPIIKALREGLSANRIAWIVGIVNGTTNFILSAMRDKNLDFCTALKQAQTLGYAEADPTFDIEGIDAAHKMSILSAMAFGVPMQFSKVYTEGITQLHSVDIRYAEQFGYHIKLLGITRRVQSSTGDHIELRVHPTLVPKKRLLAHVHGAMNAIMIQGDAVGATMYYGPGAGGEATASSVIADLVDVTRLHTADPDHRVPHLAFQPDTLANFQVLPIEDIHTCYYLRLRVADEPGVLAEITRCLSLYGISIDALNQHEAEEGEQQTNVVMLTHRTQERKMLSALARIEQLPTVLTPVIKIRMETLE